MNYTKRVVNIFCLSVFIFLFGANFVSALVISEIQFDPSGSDTDREWVEIFNDSQNSLDLTAIKFFENNTNHGIDALSGDKNILSGEYIVLVQDQNKFKTDFPNYSGKIFQSSFSLSNSGESLSLKDKDGNILYTINYANFLSGIVSGQTVFLDGNNFTKGIANPGTGNLVIGNIPQVDNSSTSTNATTTNSTTNATTSTTDASGNFVSPIYYHRSYWPESEKVYLDIGENKIGVVGADINFIANAVMGDKRPASNANYFWSFGDGETGEGKNIFHVYKYPGEYTVDAEVYSGGYKNESRIYIKIIDPEIKIKLLEKNSEKVVEVNNKTKEEINIGGLLLKSSGGEEVKTTTLPKKLSIMPGKTIFLSQQALKFATGTNFVSLSFQNGKVLAEASLESVNTKAKNKIISEIKKVETLASTSVISVFTKEEFEKLEIQKKLSKNITKNSTQNNYRFAAKSPNEKKTVVENSNQNSDSVNNNNNFVVKSDESGMLKNLFNYFGI